MSSTTIPATVPTQAPSTAATNYGLWTLVNVRINGPAGNVFPAQFVLRKSALASDGSTLIFSPFDVALKLQVPDLLADPILSTAFTGILSAVQQYGGTNHLT